MPRFYFEKPLEFISCLPCKSQFIKLDIVKEYEIAQPDIRSGQDGVFSHLVLSHSHRIGMAAQATFHYTHAREGSTFLKHLNNHDIVPVILAQHYKAITAHYDKHALWDQNAQRLLAYISDESLKNRLDPHYSHLTDDQKFRVFRILSEPARRAVSHLPTRLKQHIHPAVLALGERDPEELAMRYGKEWLGKKVDLKWGKSGNFEKDGVIICKYDRLTERVRVNGSVNGTLEEAPERARDAAIPMNGARAEPRNESEYLNNGQLRVIEGKLDLAINTVNNAHIQLIAAMRSGETHLNAEGRGIVATLTTLPHRLGLVHYAIESIFRQTLKPTRVILWITNKSQRMIAATPDLKSLVKRGLEIRYVDDVGPHTKLIYALKEFPDEVIVTFDDDVVYPINMLECLWSQHQRFPKAVVGNWVRELSFDKSGVVQGVRSGRLLTPPLLEQEIEQRHRFIGVPNLLGFPYGTSGVLYPPAALHPKVFDVQTFTRLCPKEDDIWFKAMSLMNRVPVVATNLGINPVHHCITGSQYEALRHDNHAMNQNATQMQRVFRELRLYQYL